MNNQEQIYNMEFNELITCINYAIVSNALNCYYDITTMCMKAQEQNAIKQENIKCILSIYGIDKMESIKNIDKFNKAMQKQFSVAKRCQLVILPFKQKYISAFDTLVILEFAKSRLNYPKNLIDHVLFENGINKTKTIADANETLETFNTILYNIDIE